MEAASIQGLLDQARQGDRVAVGKLLEDQRGRLERMLSLRIDGRLRGRIDPSDVIQDAFLEASCRLEEYLRDPRMPFYLWVRYIVSQRLHTIYREHLGAQKRDARREISIDQSAGAATSSRALAAHLLGTLSTPSQAAVRSELRDRLREAIESMEPFDREVIALRHFEQLGNSEVAQLLGLEEPAASRRYFRAIRRLRDLVARIPGMAEYPWK
jgi:RNA polymerase sigma-70 factor (ECF subfamily)